MNLTNSFLEDQAKARGMTVSEMMAERGKRGGLSRRGHHLTEEHKRKLREAYKKNAKTRQNEKTNPSPEG